MRPGTSDRILGWKGSLVYGVNYPFCKRLTRHNYYLGFSGSMCFMENRC